jgi:hypothetical protein
MRCKHDYERRRDTGPKGQPSSGRIHRSHRRFTTFCAIFVTDFSVDHARRRGVLKIPVELMQFKNLSSNLMET